MAKSLKSATAPCMLRKMNPIGKQEGEIMGKEVKNPALRDELLAMREADQAAIAETRLTGQSSRQIEVVRKNTERLKELLLQHGWPTRSMVGKEASKAAWLLAQHSDHDVDFQGHALELLEEQAKVGEVGRSDVAYLIDRVRVNSKQEQLFGTQFFEDADHLISPRPIYEPDKLDERRKEHGLPPFAEYEKAMNNLQKKK